MFTTTVRQFGGTAAAKPRAMRAPPTPPASTTMRGEPGTLCMGTRLEAATRVEEPDRLSRAWLQRSSVIRIVIIVGFEYLIQGAASTSWPPSRADQFHHFGGSQL